MSNRLFSRTMPIVVTAVGLSLAACNKQPSPALNGAAAGNGGPAEAPPIAALPLATASPPAAAPAPPANALPAPTQRLHFSPARPSDRYRYLENAYRMGTAFADTPPDYTVDYQGTRPWIWRARNGAYRIIERQPRGERYYYYEPGEQEPFLVRDPDYSYAYDQGRLVGVYGADGEPLAPGMAAMLADEASRYFDRSRELYRAAQYQRRQAAYAQEWAQRREEVRNEHRLWEEEQSRDRDWRAWHETHQREEAQQWAQERDRRLAYAQAIGIQPGSSGPLPSPDEIARRQAAYFAVRNAPQQQSQAPVSKAAPATVATAHPTASPPLVRGAAPVAGPTHENVTGAAQPTTTDRLHVEQVAAAAKQKEGAEAQAKALQAAQAQKSAADEKRKEGAAAQASAAQAAQAQKAADQARQKEVAAAQAKVAHAADAQKAAAEAGRKEAATAQAKAAQAAQAEKIAAQAKQKEAAAAQARTAEAAAARQAAHESQAKEAAAAQARAAQAAAAQKARAEAKQHQAAAAQIKAHPEPQGSQSAVMPRSAKVPAPAAQKPANGAKTEHQAKKDHGPDREQQQ